MTMNDHDPETHDPKESLTRRTNRVGSRLFALHLLLCLGKCVGGIIGGSYALVADGVNSLREVGAGVPILFRRRRIGRRRHERHPYDHGAIEAATVLTTSFVILIIAGAVGVIAWRRLFDAHAAPDSIVLVFAVVAIGVKEGMHRMQRRLATQLRSTALQVNARRRRTDIAATLAVLLASVAVRVGGPSLAFCDDIATMAIAVLMAYGAASTLWRPGLEVIDRAPREGILSAVEGCVRRFATDGTVDPKTAIVRRLGSHAVLEVQLSVPPNRTVRDARQIAERIREHILLTTPHLNDAVVHVMPGEYARDPESHPGA